MGTLGTIFLCTLGIAALSALVSMAPDLYWVVRRRLLRRRGWMPIGIFLKKNGLNVDDVQKVCRASDVHVRMKGSPYGAFMDYLIDGETATLILDRVKALSQAQAAARKDTVEKVGLAATGALIGALAASLTKSENSNAGDENKYFEKPKKEKIDPDLREFRFMKFISNSYGKAEIWIDRSDNYLFKNINNLFPDAFTMRSLLHKLSWKFDLPESRLERIFLEIPVERHEGSMLLSTLLLSSHEKFVISDADEIGAPESSSLLSDTAAGTHEVDPARQTRKPRRLRFPVKVPKLKPRPTPQLTLERRPPLKRRWLRETDGHPADKMTDDLRPVSDATQNATNSTPANATDQDGTH